MTRDEAGVHVQGYVEAQVNAQRERLDAMVPNPMTIVAPRPSDFLVLMVSWCKTFAYEYCIDLLIENQRLEAEVNALRFEKEGGA